MKTNLISTTLPVKPVRCKIVSNSFEIGVQQSLKVVWFSTVAKTNTKVVKMS